MKMPTFLAVVILCSFKAGVASNCETHKVKSYGHMLPYTCLAAGQQIAKRYIREGMGIKRIKCEEIKDE